ncbi:hypothetical protein JFN88_02640 [Paenibacillus sp. MAHUQ-46]|uniref:Uncharacterized protein n=1 Tax=Paenibacillus roseus TaxID=2798579 RepID=A0A934MNV4_9BACL|nr:hypothetical protein [Paenibacillus roseus]
MYVFLSVWVILIVVGVVGTMWYTDHTKRALTAQLEAQTASKLAVMQQHYEERIEAVEKSFADEILNLGSKVESLNELLTFTKDNASNRTDNSNKLYTQINEVKKKLNELEKNLEVLK